MSSIKLVLDLETCGVDDCVECAQRAEGGFGVGPRELGIRIDFYELGGDRS